MSQQNRADSQVARTNHGAALNRQRWRGGARFPQQVVLRADAHNLEGRETNRALFSSSPVRYAYGGSHRSSSHGVDVSHLGADVLAVDQGLALRRLEEAAQHVDAAHATARQGHEDSTTARQFVALCTAKAEARCARHSGELTSAWRYPGSVPVVPLPLHDHTPRARPLNS